MPTTKSTLLISVQEILYFYYASQMFLLDILLKLNIECIGFSYFSIP
jgi:hypothetical protein